MRACINAVSLALLALSLQGCGGVQEKMQRDAIKEAIDYDKSVGDQIIKDVGFWSWITGANDRMINDYVRSLKRMPLDRCPADFQAAYHRHIDAWESRDVGLIRSTWSDIISLARLHGVVVDEKQ